MQGLWWKKCDIATLALHIFMSFSAGIEQALECLFWKYWLLNYVVQDERW